MYAKNKKILKYDEFIKFLGNYCEIAITMNSFR